MQSVMVIVGTIFLALCFTNVLASDRLVVNKTVERNGKLNKITHQSKAGLGRIVNGKNANIASYPYIVRLRVNSAGVCGASIITYTHVFTAAHCLYKNQNPASITLYGGSTSQTSGGVVFFASKVIIHPYYNPETHNYDAGIVQIKNSFQGYKNIAPIALQDAEVPSDTTCYAAGWGYNNYDRKTSPDNLQYATLQVISPQQCSAAWSGYATPQFICAQQNNNGDVCNGDSGGPFVCNDKLTGATSYGGVACRGKLPSAFTKVFAPAIREFIRSVAGI
ncbi:AGAP012692-PA [Anopheles gambiae str. PEST]|uniref:AGAP012692-PA n=1 Tax=Anopheles gambiae TaxID=7165 RepID=Q7QKR3_ANOGA|nr:AGAP012692-PA [Anopheles gambiae str. PEST]